MSVNPVSENTTQNTITDGTKAFYAESLSSYNAFQAQWDGILAADKAYLNIDFQMLIKKLLEDLKSALEALNAAIEALENTIDVEEEIKKIKELINNLSVLFNGNDVLMTLAARIECLKQLSAAKGEIGNISYNSIFGQLNNLNTDAIFSTDDFNTALNDAILGYASSLQAHQELAAAQGRGSQVGQSLSMKVIQAKNQFREIKLENVASANLNTKAEFNPQLKNLRDDGTWIQEEKIEKQKRAEGLQEEQARLARAQNSDAQQNINTNEGVK